MYGRYDPPDDRAAVDPGATRPHRTQYDPARPGPTTHEPAGYEPAGRGHRGAHAAPGRGLALPGPIGLAALVAVLLIAFGAGAALLRPSLASGGGAVTAGPEVAPGPGGAAADPPRAPAPVTGPTGAAGLAPTRTPTPEPTRPRTKPAEKPTGKPVRKAPAQPSGRTGTENEVTALVNRERERNGCGQVRTDERLRRASRGHSQDMADRNFFSHDSPDGRSPWDRAEAAGYEQAIGENIAKGQRTPASVMSAWMNSPGHRRNILNCDAKAIGVGLAYDGSTPIWTQLFGAVPPNEAG